jgi:hypothetical protein
MSLLDTASLIVTPNGYKEGKLYSVIPSDGSGDMSVVRATTATRVNSAGLVELVPYNLLEQSSAFNISPWVNSGVTLTSGITDVNGGNKAFGFQCSATTSYIYNLISSTIGVQYTHSVYVRAVSGTKSIRISDAYQGGGVNTTITTEWQRITLTLTATGNNIGFQIDNNFGAYATDIYICFAQTEQGATATDYYPTETRLNIPRLDYSNGTCPSLLVEPQRTNLLTWSSSFDNASWDEVNASINANNTTSPDGTQNADKIIEDNTTNVHHIKFANGITPSGTNTLSVYAKASERNWIWLYLFDGGAGSLFAWFDVSNGTLGSVNSGLTATIEDANNGWYRCTITRTQGATGNGGFGITNANAVITYTGNGTSGAFFYGAQLEVGSYPTSYIPTTSASVTRNADVISKTGISSLIGQTEGTMFMDCKINALPIDGSLFGIQKTASNFVIRFGSQGNNIYAQCFNGSSNLFFEATSYTLGSRVKVAFAYKLGSYAFYINGVQIAIGSNATAIPACDETMFNSLWGNFNNSLSFYNSAALWQTRLDNATLAQLTTI